MKRALFFLLITLIAGNWMPAHASKSEEPNTRKETRDREKEILREMQFGRVIAFQISKTYPMLEDEALTRYVNLVGKSVALFSGRSDFEYRFAILDTEKVNAYAAPGGYIFITLGALRAMKNEAELAGVLAHEIAHVNLKHILKELPPPRDEQTWVDRLAAVLSSQGTMVSSAMNQVAEQAVKILFEKGLQKEAEIEADTTGASYLSATGYATGALIDYLNTIDSIAKQNAKAAVYNTHPPLQERMTAIQNFLKKEKIANKGQSVSDRFATKMKALPPKKEIPDEPDSKKKDTKGKAEEKEKPAKDSKKN